jgi:sensor c-di-GMP phosphodiesterase-like protein
VVYQPIVELPDGRIVGAEALLRWIDEDGNTVGPDVFVRIAEERGFVEEITRLVLRHILRDFGATLRNHPGFRISINVAAADLSDPEFLPMLDRSLERAGVPAQSLAIEITESSTANNQVAIETILSLRNRGHSVHIDDFGTGYSSLAYLHDLAVDAIKIDKAFTQAIGTGSVIVAILPQILSMAEALDLAVVVEGVETQEQADYFASDTRPIRAQGWLFGRPVPAEVLQRELAHREAKSRMTMAGAA